MSFTIDKEIQRRTLEGIKYQLDPYVKCDIFENELRLYIEFDGAPCSLWCSAINKYTPMFLVLGYRTLPTVSNFSKRNDDGTFAIDKIVDRVLNFKKFEKQYFEKKYGKEKAAEYLKIRERGI